MERMVATNNADARARLAGIHEEVVALGRRMDRMEETLHGYMAAGFDRDYNRTLVFCLEHRERVLPPANQIGFDAFSECLADFRARATFDARDALLTDRSTPLDDASLAVALADPSLENLARRFPLLGRVAEHLPAKSVVLVTLTQ
jgi:hypothetical protein